MKNYYKIMGIGPQATDAELKQVYRQKAKALHPDLNRDNPDAASQLADVNEAYEVLSDPTKRAEYDKQYNAAMAQRAAAQNMNMNAQRTANQGYAARPVPPQFNNPYEQYKAGYSTRFQAAAQAMANAQAMAQARQQQAQIENAIKQAYNDGYAKGYSDAGVKISEWENKYRADTAALNMRIKSLETELAAAEKDITAQTEKLAQMIAEDEEHEKKEAEIRSELENKTQKKEKEKKSDRETEELTRRAEFYKHEYETLKVNLEKSRDKLKAAEERFADLQSECENLTQNLKDAENENLELQTKIAEYEEYVQQLEADESIDKVILERELKLKNDKKEFKNTYYGTLGVNFWAEEEEIKQNYEKLSKRYVPKAENGDEKAKEKVKALEEAFATVSDSEKRAEYDKTLDITPESVEKERELERNYNQIIENYNRSKEEQEFKAYLDELMMLAQSGDDEAQNTLGEMYYYGEDIEPDYDQAAFWFKEAAKQQNPAALYNLGLCFLDGAGLEKDETKGIGFIKQAAKLGYKEAEKFLKNK